ncbi:MAG TPA: hypothetical protein EYQ26_14815 [Rhodospirillales bacterium]|jgi:hypothetical protein|nr:hypothetical protein [Rhodospirillales bacterium]HIL74424.1 hypothetical protein [Rhodospirillales bacterium]
MFKFASKIRIVPAIIFAAVLVLSFRINDIPSNIGLTLNTLSVSKVRAQAPSVKKGADIPKVSSTKTPIKASMVLAKAHSDPTLFTENDINVLLELTARRELIDARSEQLTLQEGLLGAAEKRIDKKILELKNLIAALKKTIKKKNK